jgi:hypothetical protein
MGFNGKEFYWDKYTKQAQIRFIRNQFENRLSYLFTDIKKTGYSFAITPYCSVVCRRYPLVLVLSCDPNPNAANININTKIVIKAIKTTEPYANNNQHKGNCISRDSFCIPPPDDGISYVSQLKNSKQLKYHYFLKPRLFRIT